MPRRSRRLNPPCLLDGLSDDVVMRMFSRAPFTTHGTLHGVCRRLKTLLRSPEFLQQRVDSGLAEYGLVVAGGLRDGRLIADCSMFVGGQWRPIAPLSSPRYAACSAIVEDEDGQPEMWVMGGFGANGSGGGKTVEAYNPRTNTWRSCLPMRSRRLGAVAGVVGGRLIVAGGYGGYDGDPSDRLTSVEAYSSNGWTPLPPLPHATEAATARVLDGRFYVMGGEESDKVQVLEMTEENEFTWSVKAALPGGARQLASSACFEDKLWLLGGYDEHGAPTTSVLLYDVQSDSWATGPALPKPVGCCAAATVSDGKVHVTCFDDHEHEKLYCYTEEGWALVLPSAGTAIFEAATLESVLLG